MTSALPISTDWGLNKEPLDAKLSPDLRVKELKGSPLNLKTGSHYDDIQYVTDAPVKIVGEPRGSLSHCITLAHQAVLTQLDIL